MKKIKKKHSSNSSLKSKKIEIAHETSKEKGKKKALSYMLNKVFTEGVDTSKPIVVLHADIEDECDYMIDKLKEKFGADVDIWKQDIGPIIGAHCGPGTVGVVYVKK